MRERQREETRRRLYQAALEIFRRDGVASCRIDDISQKAEVSRAAFYFHFPTKEAVLLQLLAESEAPLEKALQALPREATLEQVLAELSRAFAEFWKNEAELLPDVISVALRHTAILTDDQASVSRVLLHERFRAAAERGDLTKDATPEGLADTCMSVFMTAMLAWARHRTMPLEQALDVMAKLFLRGTRP